MDTHCSVDLEWCSSTHVGCIVTPAGNVPYSALGLTQCGKGPSPELLLIAAISSSYSISLSSVLQAASLPQKQISVHADGVIARDLGREEFTRVTVNPTIHGADALRRNAYQRAAIRARDDCLIGKSIRGNIAYIVAGVSLPQSTD